MNYTNLTIGLIIIFCCSFIFMCKKTETEIETGAGTRIETRTGIDVFIETQIANAENEADHQKSIEILQTVLVNKDFEQATEKSKSSIYHKLGHYYYQSGFSQANQFEKAIVYLDTAIMIRTSNPLHEKKDIANSYYIRALVKEQFSQYKNAREDIFDAIQIAKEDKVDLHILGTYYSKEALYLLYQGEGNEAKKSLEEASDNLKPDSKEMAEYFNHAGLFYAANGNRDEAQKDYNKAIDIFGKLLPAEENNFFSVKFNLQMLICQELDIDSIEKVQLKFISDLENHKTQNDHLKNLKLKSNNIIAYYSWANNKFEKAEEYYTKVLELAKELSPSKKSELLAVSYEGLGDVALGKRSYIDAIQNYHKAIESLCIGFEDNDFHSLPTLQKHAIISDVHLERIMGFKADAFYQKYVASQQLTDLEATFQIYKTLDELLTQMRQGYKAAISSYVLVERTIPMYEKTTEIALQLFERTKDKKYLEQAFYFATKNKAIVLLDGLKDEQAMFSGVPAKVLEEERKLKSELYKLEGDIFDLINNKEQTETELKSLVKDRFEKTSDYESLIKELEEKYPKYYQLKYANLDKTDVDDLIRQLPDSVLIIEYFIGIENIYTFTISKESGLQYSIQANTGELKSACKTFREMTEAEYEGGLADFAKVSNFLYDKLLKTALQNLEQKEYINRLFIIPDDYLMQISFDPILIEKPKDSAEWYDDSLSYLLRKYAISYAYSNQLLFGQAAENRIDRALKTYIGYGLEYDDYTLDAAKNLQTINADNSPTRVMRRLRYARKEIKESMEIFKGLEFLDEEATKSSFLKYAPTARLLHIAAHGFMVKEKPLNSGLIFIKSKSSEDYILKAADVYNMDLKAEMVVLSACHTGDGSVQRGEGVRSLARAFNYAGCPNVTASLWATPDQSTKDIIIPFYKAIKKSYPKDLALQKAKLEYIGNCSLSEDAKPYKWAHLVTIGDVVELEF